MRLTACRRIRRSYRIVAGLVNFVPKSYATFGQGKRIQSGAVAGRPKDMNIGKNVQQDADKVLIKR